MFPFAEGLLHVAARRLAHLHPCVSSVSVSVCSVDDAQVLHQKRQRLTVFDGTMRRFCISTYPGVQERVAQELGATGLLSSPSRPTPRPVEFSDIFDLPILDAVRALS